MENRRNDDRREPEIVYSHAVKAGKRIYYLDVKKARNDDLYLCITESKRKSVESDGSPLLLEKHRVFLYKEDFAHFVEGLKDVISFVESQVGTIEERQIYVRDDSDANVQVAEPKTVEASAAESEDVAESEKPAQPQKRGFFSRLISK